MMQVFANVWSAAPQAQASLRKLLATWASIFPEAVLTAVASHIGGSALSSECSAPTPFGCLHSDLICIAPVAKE